MTLHGLALALLAILAGALISLQAPINAMAGQRLGHAFGGALLSFCAGTLALLLIAAVFLREQIDFASMTSLEPMLYAGGLLGAFYVVTSIWLTPQLGVGAVISLGIAGQLLAGLLLDNYGLLGLAVREMTTGRLAGAGLVLIGALMVRYL